MKPEFDRRYEKAVQLLEQTPEDKQNQRIKLGPAIAKRDYAIFALFIGTGLRITELVGINTLDIKFYNNKFADNTVISLTDDLTNVDTTMTSAQVEIYNDYTKVFGVTISGVVYTSAWDPQVTTVQIDNNTYYNFDGKSNVTGTNYAYTYDTSAAGNEK